MPQTARVFPIFAAAIQFRYIVPKQGKHDVGDSSLFSLTWLSKLFGKGVTEDSISKQARDLDGEVVARMKLKSVSVRRMNVDVRAVT